MICFPINNVPKIEKIGVYAVHNKVNDKYYIGSAFNLYVRLSQYERNWRIRNSLLETRKIDEDFIKYGWNNFEFIILETFESGTIKYEELYQKEKEYAIKYNSIYPNGYNTIYPAPTNSKRYGQPIICQTTDETKGKRKEHNKQFTVISWQMKKSDVEKLNRLVADSHKSRNAYIVDLLDKEVFGNIQ